MTRHTHAADGAWSLRIESSATTPVDSRRSIDLVGTPTTTAPRIAPRADGSVHLAVLADGMADPIEAARAWLCDTSRTAHLPPELIEQARASIAVAFTHFREMDLLAGQLASDANETGTIDETRIGRINHMAEVLRSYSDSLRDLMDTAVEDPERATKQLSSGMRAASEGGLTALVAAL